MEKESLFKRIGKILLILILTAIFILGTELLGGVVFGLISNDLGFDINVNNIMTDYYPILLISVQTTRLVAVLCLIAMRKMTFEKKYDLSYIKKDTIGLQDFFRLLVIAFGIMAISNLIVFGLVFMGEFVPPIKESYKILEELTEMLDDSYPIVGFISAVIMAPILEELMLRGVIFEEMNRIVSLKTAVILNGIVFGIFHMNIIQGAYATAIGIIICLIYYYTDSIYAAILVHFFNNLISSLVASNNTLNLIYTLVVFISLPIAFKLLKGYRDRKEYRDKNTYIIA